MLSTLISSKTRLKLLLKFFLNSQSSAYLRNLETEFGASTNAIRLELNKFEQAGLLESHMQGNKKLFQANTKHPLFGDIHNILIKHFGFDTIIETVTENIGNLQKVFLTGAFAKGMDSDIIDIICVGENINKEYLLKMVDKAEKLIKHKIRYMLMKAEEFVEYRKKIKDGELLLLWEKEE
ncbi:ArsR family transcriptional regulator [Bacteroidota bacterium]